VKDIDQPRSKRCDSKSIYLRWWMLGQSPTHATNALMSAHIFIVVVVVVNLFTVFSLVSPAAVIISLIEMRYSPII